LKVNHPALLVEDEEALASAILIALKQTDLSPVVHVTTLKAAESAIQKNVFDIILLDRNLPDGEGTEIIPVLNRLPLSVRPMVLVLSARGTTQDKVEGLDLGADDYLSKPFTLEELTARIKAMLRRLATSKTAIQSSEPTNPPLDWSLDANSRKVFSPTRGWIALTPIEFKLASHLILNAGKVLTREELLKNVWGFRFLAKTRTVDFFLGKLRRQFEDNPIQPKHFLTLRGAGYKFEY